MTHTAKHTPWEYIEDETSSGYMFSVYNEHGKRITESYISEEEAKLIAAAPGLITALQQVQYNLNRITISTAITALGRDKGLEERRIANKLIDAALAKAGVA